MGTHMEDCRKVAKLVGIKTFVNEFVAYMSLSVYIDNVKNLTWYEGLGNLTLNGTSPTWHYNNDDIVYDHLNITLEGGVLDVSVILFL